jgi:hypothetical protein
MPGAWQPLKSFRRRRGRGLRLPFCIHASSARSAYALAHCNAAKHAERMRPRLRVSSDRASCTRFVGSDAGLLIQTSMSRSFFKTTTWDKLIARCSACQRSSPRVSDRPRTRNTGEPLFSSNRVWDPQLRSLGLRDVHSTIGGTCVHSGFCSASL